MSLKLTVQRASAMVLDGIFKQADARWEEILSNLVPLLKEANIHPKGSSEFAKFHFSIAAIAVNMRAAFDVFPRHLAEKLSTCIFQILESSFTTRFPAVKSLIFKYIEAYDAGIIRIRNPLIDVGMLLYYKIGLDNTGQKVADEEYFVPAPRVVEFLSNALMMFTGKWEALIQRYELEGSTGHASDEDGPGKS